MDVVGSVWNSRAKLSIWNPPADPVVVEEEHARELARGVEVGEVDGRAASSRGHGDEGGEGRVERRQRGEVRRRGGVAVPRVHRPRRLRVIFPPPLLPSAHLRRWGAGGGKLGARAEESAGRPECGEAEARPTATHSLLGTEWLILGFGPLLMI